jgi:hypothetical protein
LIDPQIVFRTHPIPAWGTFPRICENIKVIPLPQIRIALSVGMLFHGDLKTTQSKWRFYEDPA